MAFKSFQLTLDADTPTPTIVVGSGDDQILNWPGSVTGMVPISIKNEDASAIVYWGGPGVDDSSGQSIAPGASVPMNVYGASEIPYVYSTGTPIVSVVVGQQ